MKINGWITKITFFTVFLFSVINAQDIFQMTGEPHPGDVQSIVINSSGHIFALTDYELFRSTDNGNSWKQIGYFYNDRSLSLNSEQHIFVGTSSGVYRSVDNGDNWEAIGPFDNIIWSITINSSGHIFAGAHSYAYIYRSVDDGETWVPLVNTFAWCLAINSNGYVFAGTNEVLISMDNGDHWTKTNLQIEPGNGMIYTLLINSNDDIFAGTVNGVYRSKDNGENWVTTDLTEIKINTLAMKDNGYILAGTDSNGVFISYNNGDSWNQTVLEGKRINTLAVNKSGAIFAGGDSLGIYRSDDNGENWIQSGIITSINQKDKNIPDLYFLNQNYPNPFNPTTNISYQMPKTSNVSLKVYDINGREVSTLVNQNQAAGNYSVNFDANGLSSGIYIYKLIAGSYQQSRKMILVR